MLIVLAHKGYNSSMRRTYKYRLFPTAAQRTALLRALDACRWVYNQTLEAVFDKVKVVHPQVW